MINNRQAFSEINEDPDTVRLILWLIETRESNLYKKIQSIPPERVKDSIMAQAENLVFEYRNELADSKIDVITAGLSVLNVILMFKLVMFLSNPVLLALFFIAIVGMGFSFAI